MSKPTLAPLDHELVLFPARVGEERVPTSPRSYAEYTEEGSEYHCTTGDIALHISLHSAFQRCNRLDQAEGSPNPLPPMAAEHGFISVMDSAPGEEQEDHAQPDDVIRVRVCFCF